MHIENETSIVRYLMDELSNNIDARELVYLGCAETGNSYLFRFMVKAASITKAKQILVKLFKSNQCMDLPSNPSENSYNFLMHLCKISSDNSEIVIPKPIAILPELNGLAKEWLVGDSLRELMRLSGRFSSNGSRRILEAHFRNVGEAIGFLHSKTYDQSRCSAKLHMDRKLENLSKSIEQLRFNIYLKHIKRAVEYVKQTNSNISWNRVGTSWVHGDFVHSNILVTAQGQIGILDFSDSRFDSPLFDVSRFMLRTIIDFGYMPNKFSKQSLLELNRSFLRGYLSLFGKEIPEDLFMLYSIFNLIQFISPAYTSDVHLFLRNNYSLILLKKYMQACKAEGY
jgi:tRNA A-37 threonylcarbamoyl transferase component Bud32